MKFFASLLLSMVMLFAFTVIPTKQTHSQIVREITITAADDTLVNVDTAAVTLTFDGTFKSFEAMAVRVSGTAAGTWYFQGKSLDGGSWANLDSLVLTNTASQYKIFTVPSPRLHYGYRLLLYSTNGTAAIKPRIFTCRYTGG